MRDVYILGSVRTAIGAFGGSLKNTGAVELGRIVIAEACCRSDISGRQVDEVLMGNVLQAGLGQNPARQAAMKAEIPYAVPAATINKVCGSGLYAVNLAAILIGAGRAECMVAGGMENMSRTPHLLNARWGQKMGDMQVTDSMVHEGLWDAFFDYHMGVTAENVAEKWGVTREMQDEFALKSQQKALKASKAGRFKDEIVNVEVAQGKNKQVRYDADEYIRETSLEALSKLRPAFKKDGTVTAGNASGINDGAAAMVVASGEFVERNHLKPQAKWIGGSSCGVLPQEMGIGPVPSIRKVLKQTGLTLKDIELLELNEAFAAQALAVMQELSLSDEKINVNGGAIALGHPIGASGARIATTLLHEMQKREGRYGLASLCIGGGMGEATVFERDGLCR